MADDIVQQNRDKFLDFIGRSEGADWNTIVGGKKFQDYSSHPNVVGLRTKDGPSTASGKFQITKTTYDSVAPSLGITDFSPESQKAIGVELIKRRGALADVDAGNFDSAIKKLGNEWVSLPSSTNRNQPKRSWDWARQQLGDPSLGQGNTVPLDVSSAKTFGDNAQRPSAFDLFASERERDRKQSFLGDLPQATVESFKANNSIYNWYQTRAASQADSPQVDWSSQEGQKYLQGFSPEHWNYILQAKTMDEAGARGQRVKDAQESMDKLSQFGTATKLVGGVAGTLPDVPTLLGLFPGIGSLSGASRISNAVRMGLTNGMTTLAYDAVANNSKPLATGEDLLIGTAMGTAMGAGAGLLINPKYIAMAQENRAMALAAKRTANQLQVEELKASGLNLTPMGERVLGNSYSEDDLTAVGVHGNSKRLATANMLAEDSNDLTKAGYSDMKALKNTDTTASPNVAAARVALSEAFGPDVAEGLEGSGRLKLLHSQEDLPESLRHEKGVNALYDPLTDTTFLMADRVNKDNIRGIIMHDVGVHQGLERVVGTEIYNKMIATVEQLAANGDTAATSAIERAMKGPTAGFLKNEEKLAYFIEHVGGKAANIFQEAFAKIKAFLIQRFGMDINLNEKDLISIVQGSVRKVALDKHFGSFNKGFPFVWHGGPVKGIDKLSTEFVGTGEGNVNQGWGLYTTSSKFVANWYRGKESAARGLSAEDGGLYQLKVNPNVSRTSFLKWDSPSQSKEVLKALEGAGIPTEGKTGREIYFDLMGKVDGDTPLEKAKAVSQTLDSLGITGNEYATGNTKNKNVKSSNLVFFSDRHFDISARYSVGDAFEEAPATRGMGLSYESVLLGPKAPNKVRSLASQWIAPTGGYADNSVAKVSASEDATAWSKAAVVRTRKEWMPLKDEWSKEKGFKSWQDAEATDAFADKVHSYILGFEEEFDPQVIKAGEVQRKEYARWVDHANNPLLDTGGYKKGLTETVIVDPVTGAEEIVGTLQKNPNFLPRKHDSLKWADVFTMAENGREKAIAWWAGARRSTDPQNISEEQALRFGKRYVSVVEAAHANRAQDLLEDMIKGGNKEALRDQLQHLKDNNGNHIFTAQEAMDAAEDLIPQKNNDSGRLNSSLKHRNTINERYKETWTTKDGREVEVSLKSFVHTNVFDTAEQYYRRMAGSIALAKHSDIYKAGDILSKIEEATHNEFGGMPSGELAKYRKHLQEVADGVQGMPREEWTWWRKGLSMLNTYNVLRLGGGFVWNQATELGQMTGTMGLKNTLRAVPEMEGLSRDLKTGKAPHDYLQYLENTIGGSGAEYVERVNFKANDDWVRHLGDTTTNQRLDKADYWMKKTADGVLTYTGMTPLMIQQKRVHAVSLMNHFVDVAHGAESKFFTKERLAWMGMTEEDFTSLKSAIKDYSKPAKGEFSDHMKLDVEKFARERPEIESKLRMGIFRETRRAIQENDLASTIPLMGTTVGQTVFQFMNFAMNAWEKQMMFSWNHRDISTFNTILHSSMLAYLAYTGRTYAQSLGMDEKKRQKFLEDRLNTKQVVANTFGRLSMLSLLPNIYDSLPFTQPMFSGMRTTADVSGIASLPTMQLLNDTVKASKKLGRNTFSSETQTTDKDIKAMARLTPLNNVWPISNFWNGISAGFPDSPKQ